MSLQVKSLHKSFNQSKILDNISFELPASSLMLVSGENGIGKSTFLSCLAGMLDYDLGEVTLNEQIPDAAFQGSNLYLYEDLTILENLMLYARLLKINNVLNYVQNLISHFLLSDFADKKIRNCSYGIRKRTSLARVALFAKELIILDEPEVGLDNKAQELLLSYIKAQKEQGAVIIIASHDSALYSKLLTHAFSLNSGSYTFGAKQ